MYANVSLISKKCITRCQYQHPSGARSFAAPRSATGPLLSIFQCLCEGLTLEITARRAQARHRSDGRARVSNGVRQQMTSCWTRKNIIADSERISRFHANRVHASTLQIHCFRAEWPDPSSSENSTGSSAAVLQAIFAERRKNPLLSSFQTFCVKQAKKTIDKGLVDYWRVPRKYASNFWGY